MESTNSPGLPRTIVRRSASAAINFVLRAFRMALAALSAMSRSASPTSLGCFVTASSLLQPHTRTAAVLGLARDLAAQRRPIAGAIVVCEDAGDVVRFVE